MTGYLVRIEKGANLDDVADRLTRRGASVRHKIEAIGVIAVDFSGEDSDLADVKGVLFVERERTVYASN